MKVIQSFTDDEDPTALLRNTVPSTSGWFSFPEIADVSVDDTAACSCPVSSMKNRLRTQDEADHAKMTGSTPATTVQQCFEICSNGRDIFLKIKEHLSMPLGLVSPRVREPAQRTTVGRKVTSAVNVTDLVKQRIAMEIRW